MPQCQKNLDDSFERWVNYKKAQEKTRNYNMTPSIYRQHPKEDCIHAIEFASADGLQRRGGATLILAGDKTTWLDGRLQNHLATAEDPLIEKEARASSGAQQSVTRASINCHPIPINLPAISAHRLNLEVPNVCTAQRTKTVSPKAT
jgi:hypothetical protein